MEKKPILKIENMNIVFGEKTIVKNGEFEVNAGQFVLILGENGAGKSSIFRSIVQDGKTGERDMYFNGKVVSDIDSFRRAIGYASQEDDPESFFAKRVENYVKDYVINSEGLPLKDIDNAIDEVCEALGCNKQFMSRRLSKCSGGEKRMASLLRALSRTKSDLFILDEPINNLDAHHARLLNNYLVRLKERENPPGILVITHCHMFQRVDRVYKLSKGELKEETKDYSPKSCYGECNECGLYTEEE